MMMKIRKNRKVLAVILTLATLVLSVIMLHGCGVSSYEDAPPEATSGAITITKGGSIQVGAAPVQMTATLNGANVTTQVTWSSSNTTIATIDSSGLVTALMAGKSTITATLGAQTGTLSITCYAAAGH